MNNYLLEQLENEISWIKVQLVTRKLSQKHIKEYEKQIKHKELSIAFLKGSK